MRTEVKGVEAVVAREGAVQVGRGGAARAPRGAHRGGGHGADAHGGPGLGGSTAGADGVGPLGEPVGEDDETQHARRGREVWSGGEGKSVSFETTTACKWWRYRRDDRDVAAPLSFPGKGGGKPQKINCDSPIRQQFFSSKDGASLPPRPGRVDAKAARTRR